MRQPRAGFKILDVFSGAGGLSLGFAREGFEVVAAVEQAADAAATYRGVHDAVQDEQGRGDGPAVKLHEQDVADVDFRQYAGQVDAVVGGPPCQPWSLGGLRRGEADPRDGFPQFARAVREVVPAAFVMENVAGLARGATREALDRLVAVLAGCLGPTYTLTWRVLQAAQFGVPQNRQRLFIVGVRQGLPFEWPVPTHGPGTTKPFAPAGSVIGPEPFGDPNPSIVTYASNPSLRPRPYHGQIFNGGGRPIDLARPAPTLLASMGGNKTPWVDTLGVVPEYHALLLSGGRPRSGQVPGARRISVAEAAALQSFPRWVAFCGARCSQYRQVGNAVPPLLGQAVAKQVAASLTMAA